jgi:fructose-specific phosphotransferase system IIA component
MKLTDILTSECVKVPLNAVDKVGAIEELVDLLVANGLANDRDTLLEQILAREEARTTGIGHGLAIPHGKSDAVRDLVIAVGKPAEPIDFASIDREPVNVVVLLASPPTQTGPHIQALARVSRLMLMEKFRSAVAQAQSSEELYGIIAGHEG